MNKSSFQGEIRIAQRVESAAIPVTVFVAGNSMVLGRGIKLPKKDAVIAGAVIVGAGEQHIQSIGERFAKRCPGFVGIELAVLAGSLDAVQLAGLASDDVDYREKGVVAIEHGA